MFQIKNLSITHKKDLRSIVQNFSLVLNDGDKAVMIGEEGNGKSTVLKWMYDPELIEEYAEGQGERILNRERLGYLAQGSKGASSPATVGIADEKTIPGAGGLSASWELDIWGKTRKGVESAEAQALAAEEGLNNLRISLMKQVATGYLRLIMLDEQLKIANEAVESYRDSLKLFENQLENGVAYVAAGGTVQQEVVTTAGHDGHGVVGNHVVNLVRVDAGSVDNDLGFVIALDGLYLPAAVDLLDAGNFAVELELNAVGSCVFSQSKVQAEGADNGAGGSVQSGNSVVGDVGLHGNQLVPLNDSQAFHTVLHAVFIQLDQVGTVFLADHDDQRTVALVVEVQILGQLLHHEAALDVQLGHQRTIGGVVAGMDDGGVGLGGAAADIFCALQNQDISLLTGQFAGDGTAGNTCADDDNIDQVQITP